MREAKKFLTAPDSVDEPHLSQLKGFLRQPLLTLKQPEVVLLLNQTENCGENSSPQGPSFPQKGPHPEETK